VVRKLTVGGNTDDIMSLSVCTLYKLKIMCDLNVIDIKIKHNIKTASDGVELLPRSMLFNKF